MYMYIYIYIYIHNVYTSLGFLPPALDSSDAAQRASCR